MEQELREIVLKMDEFSNKYDCRIKVETIEAREIPNDRKRCIYDLKVIKE